MADSLPKTFKAVVVEQKDGPMILKDLPLEQPQAGEILVKVLAVGVCHSDSMLSPGIFGNPLYVDLLFRVCSFLYSSSSF